MLTVENILDRYTVWTLVNSLFCYVLLCLCFIMFCFWTITSLLIIIPLFLYVVYLQYFRTKSIIDLYYVICMLSVHSCM